jgi:hypothetical protein
MRETSATVSVVIPVFNEEERILETLKSIAEGTTKPLEIIVVDGRSTDKTVELIGEHYPDVIVLDNPERTAAVGRNVGVYAAHGDVIAFTDGDCVVDSKWVECIGKRFESDDIDGLGGKVLNAPTDNKYEKYWGDLAWNKIMSFPDQPYQVKEQRLNDAFVTANCAYRRRSIIEIGGFSAFFANNAEDVDLCWRMLERGKRLFYVPEAVVFAHNVTTLGGIAKKSFRNGVSSSKLQKRYGGWLNVDPVIYKMLFSNIVGLVRRQEDAGLNCLELVFHLAGKYCGSIRNGVINV